MEITFDLTWNDPNPNPNPKRFQTDLRGSSQPLLTAPNRFTRTSQSAYWNTGNGSPDAVAFTVDRPGVVIAGICIYGGTGQCSYEIEILDNVSSILLKPRIF